ncbi:MAG: hypothetical protein UU83_C0014G0017 [Candidatus Jorgensenbacteria bacterium GW2011_GWF2_41_8]|uniref:Uncharacterized protein n=1 Tax=Candidatus Jorgensenbacteria bacterium GW2011_GWF2_41_8 TaxID=1618667 RepID=A0A0G0XJB6_9BACT|nr:MAG: hypothetical protein UU83_C0014G0017 [Candidatus Jorgensenbacteria bacterium GW2011_GWF2_41_8]
MLWTNRRASGSNSGESLAAIRASATANRNRSVILGIIGI